ncbi:MAG: hypothetical protein ABJC19_05875 [Gemmatimonadota bacterium]
MGDFADLIAFRERTTAETFRHAGAISPSSARAPSELGLEMASLSRLRTRGVLRDGDLGRLYLDEEAFALMARTRRMAIAALFISFAGVVLAVWGFLRRR